MKWEIAICDDEQNQIEGLRSSVEDWAKSAGHFCEITSFVSAESFLLEYTKNRFDILLLDVELTGEDGIALAKRLRKEGDKSEIIFITSHFEFYGEGYEVDALHYLIKPVVNEKLFTVLSKAVEKLAVSPQYVIIQYDRETIKIYESEILYIESFLHYIEIHTKESTYRIKENLSTFAEKLSADFYRTHRSYITSLKAIRRISRNTVLLEGGVELPLARGKYDEINRAYIERN